MVQLLTSHIVLMSNELHFKLVKSQSLPDKHHIHVSVSQYTFSIFDGKLLLDVLSHTCLSTLSVCGIGAVQAIRIPQI